MHDATILNLLQLKKAEGDQVGASRNELMLLICRNIDNKPSET